MDLDTKITHKMHNLCIEVPVEALKALLFKGVKVYVRIT